MRAALAAAVIGWLSAGAAHAQLPPAAPPVTLTVTTEEAMLIVNTLSALGCGTVAQLALCQEALALLHTLREQVKAQTR